MYKILKKEILNENVILMDVYAPIVSKKCEAGQFIILRVDNEGERIPLTIADYDRDKGIITIIFQTVGLTTMKLGKLNIGDSILDFVGPLGNPTDCSYKKVIIIGGGVGSAIAYPIAKKFHSLGANVTSIVGFRNKDLVILEDEFKSVSDEFFLMTDDGSYMEKGLVTERLRKLLTQKQYDCVYAIGPLPMMKFVCLVTKEFNTKTIVSMNSIMIDGTGMCGCCRLSVNGKMRFACVDGPDFDGHEVDFDEAITRSKVYRTIETKKREEFCNLFKKVN